MLQKGFVPLIILFAIVFSIILTVAGFYFGRSTTSKPEPNSIITSNTSPQPKPTSDSIRITSTPSPKSNQDLVFPSVCVPPSTISNCPAASGIFVYKSLSELISGSELIVVGHIIDSCQAVGSAISTEGISSTQTLYIGHVVVERSFKNPSRLGKSVILTATLDTWPNGEQQVSSTCNILIPNKSYLLFLKKHNNQNYWSYAESPMEVQNGILVENSSDRVHFSQELILLGLDGLAQLVSRVTQ